MKNVILRTTKFAEVVAVLGGCLPGMYETFEV